MPFLTVSPSAAGVTVRRMGWIRRKPCVRHYGDCHRCGHDWREHRGGSLGEDLCGECRYEQEHETPGAPDDLCNEVAPAPPASAMR